MAGRAQGIMIPKVRRLERLYPETLLYDDDRCIDIIKRDMTAIFVVAGVPVLLLCAVAVLFLPEVVASCIVLPVGLVRLVLIALTPIIAFGVVPLLFRDYVRRSLRRDLDAHGTRVCQACGYALAVDGAERCSECGRLIS